MALMSKFSSGIIIGSFEARQNIGDSDSLNYKKLSGLMLVQISIILSMYYSLIVSAYPNAYPLSTSALFTSETVTNSFLILLLSSSCPWERISTRFISSVD